MEFGEKLTIGAACVIHQCENNSHQIIGNSDDLNTEIQFKTQKE
jgi:carbonic anhydrase/acetyltransferase-like protein (isoleucine patch superfamily)